MLNDTNIIRIAAFFPLVFAVLAMLQGILLGIKLKPGMVCKSSMHCSKCELLFALKVGTFTLSLAYFLAKTNWLIKFNGSEMTVFDELAWIALESFFMGFLAWLCRRGRLCLGIHCESETGCLNLRRKENA